MADKFGIAGVRFRYITALGIAALFCGLFVFISDISNRQFKSASHVATLIADFAGSPNAPSSAWPTR